MPTPESFDAIVVGSGAGGGAVAMALCRAGFRVLVLEKGPHYTEKDFFHDELTVCRRGAFVPSPLDEPHMVGWNGKPPSPSAETWISCCVGGGTVHMSGFFFRLHREDFRLRSLYGEVAGATVADWPIAYEELEPFYDEAERTLGVSGDATKNPFEPRAGGYPLPPLAVHPAAALVDAAAGKLGYHAYPTPRAILSQPYDGRAACMYCGFCGSYGCEVGAKSSSLVTFLANAAKTGKLTLRALSMTLRVTKTARGHARGVIYRDAHGIEHEATARVVVLACSAIQTARLLLLSELANASGLVGKNLMFAAASAGWARFQVPDPHWAREGRDWPFIDRSLQDFYLAPRAGLPYPKAGTVLFLLPHYNPIYNAEKLAFQDGDRPPVFGAALVRRMREFFHDTRTIELETFGEFLPSPGCQVGLDPKVKDRYGLPVARVEIAVHPASLAATDFLATKGLEVLGQAGAAQTGLSGDPRAYTVLQAGTARMGKSPSTSVLDATGQAHDVKNLYVADGSGFPSAGGAPYTLSIMANALRVGAHIARRGRRSDL
jgi:choline dehydrogenase-like flavoprotein